MIRLPLGYDKVICIDEYNSYPEGVPQWRIFYGTESVYRVDDDDPGEYFVEPFKDAEDLSNEISSDLPDLLKKLSEIMKSRNREI